MTMENIPWAIGGGIHSPTVARMLAYQATSGAEGIGGIGDFLVKQQAVATGSVKIAKGGAIMVSRYAGAFEESYMCRAGDETTVAVAANAGGTTRYDLVIARVDDWNQPGAQAAPATLPTNSVAAAKFQVISNVSSSTKTAKSLALNYPAIALARIAIPAGTSAVTQAMITDLREIARPRRQRDVRSINLVSADPLDFTGTSGEVWPDPGTWTFEVPEWAAACNVIARWDSIGRAGSATSTYARVWVAFGRGRADTFNTSQGRIQASNTAAERVSIGTAERRTIPSTMRGQSIIIDLKAYKESVPAGPAMNADAWSSITLDLEWLEAPSEDV